jgi:hypothetical protein
LHDQGSRTNRARPDEDVIGVTSDPHRGHVGGGPDNGQRQVQPFDRHRVEVGRRPQRSLDGGGASV